MSADRGQSAPRRMTATTGAGNSIGTFREAAIAAERSVLGACMLHEDVLDVVAGSHIDPAHLSLPSHQVLLDILLALHGDARAVTTAAVLEQIVLRGMTDQVEGSYLHACVQSVTTADDAKHDQLRIVLKAIERRRISEMGEHLKTLAALPEMDPASAMRNVLDEVASITSANEQRASWSETMMRVLSDIEEEATGQRPAGLSTGFTDLDVAMGGLRPGQLLTIGGQTGRGKTAVALDITRRVAISAAEPTPVLIFSLEMSPAELGERLLVAVSKEQVSQVRRGWKNDQTEVWDNLVTGSAEIAKAPITVIGDPQIDVAEIRRQVAIAKRKHGDNLLVIVDYLQMVSPTVKTRGNRQEEVSAIAYDLKRMAMLQNVPVIVLAQLSRRADQREGDMRPKISDLRESGAIEHASNFVVLIYRPDDRDLERVLILAKNRHGPLAETTLTLVDGVRFI